MRSVLDGSVAGIPDPGEQRYGTLAIEDVVTLEELQGLRRPQNGADGKARHGLRSGASLRGAKATDEEIYRSLVRGDEDGVGVLTAIAGLPMMIPPVREDEVKKDAPAGNVDGRFVEGAYKTAVGLGWVTGRVLVACVRGVWWHVDAREPAQTYAGGMTEEEVERLYNKG